jgi:hypothetical protein
MNNNIRYKSIHFQTKGPDCADQILNGYEEVKKFHESCLGELKLAKLLLNVTAYNYNLNSVVSFCRFGDGFRVYFCRDKNLGFSQAF